MDDISIGSNQARRQISLLTLYGGACYPLWACCFVVDNTMLHSMKLPYHLANKEAIVIYGLHKNPSKGLTHS